MAEIIANRYELVKCVGHGGMADVYLALDTILEREVAIKIMKSDISSDDISLQRFRREANASCKLSHPNVVDIYDVGDDKDKHYIVMEYVKGHTLKQLIKRRGAIGPKEAVWLMKQLTSALLEAHKNGLIHRDIKSQNVLIKNDGTVKLADFGIAILNNSMQLTSKDSVLGSVHYLAPELVKGGSANMKSDIYSLGIVFYETLCGDVPYKGDTPVQIALKHVKEDLPDIKKFNPQIPQSIINIILKATAKDPSKRYDNAAEMLRDLNHCFDVNQVSKTNTINLNENKENSTKKQEKIQNSFLKIFLILITILSVIALLAILFITGVFNVKNNDFVVIPDIVGKEKEEALSLLEEKFINYNRPEYVYNNEYAEGTIISTSPNVGTEIEKSKKIDIVISNGSYPKMKNYVGKKLNDVQNDLSYSIFDIEYEYVYEEGEENIIKAQYGLKEGDEYDPHTKVPYKIKFEVSKQNKIRIPNSLIRRNVDEVKAELEELGLKVQTIGLSKAQLPEDKIGHYDIGCVISVDPNEGEEFIINEENEVYITYYEGE